MFIPRVAREGCRKLGGESRAGLFRWRRWLRLAVELPPQSPEGPIVANVTGNDEGSVFGLKGGQPPSAGMAEDNDVAVLMILMGFLFDHVPEVIDVDDFGLGLIEV